MMASLAMRRTKAIDDKGSYFKTQNHLSWRDVFGKSSTASPDDRPAFLSPLAQYRQSPARPDQAHRQKHRSPGPDYPRTNSLPAAPETKCSDCGLHQRQSASSNPPAESLENHIIEGVFTQSGSI